jgi:hypothetical protein
MRTYQPSGRISFFGLIFFIIVGAILGAVIGVAAYLISTKIYFLVLSPLGLAAISGGLAYLAVRMGKMRSPLFGLLAGLVLGAYIYGVYWGAGYVDLLNQFVSGAPSKDGQDISSIVNQLLASRPELDRNLQRETGQPGLIGYVLLVAEEGLSFSRTTSPGSSAITLNRELTLAYWGIEALLVLGACALAGRRSAKQVFCESGNRWLKESDFQFVGTVDARVSNQFIQLLRSGDLRTAGQYVTLGRSMGLVQVKVAKCAEPDLASPGEMILRVTRSAGNKTNELLTGVVTPHEYKMLIDNAQQRAPLGAYTG